MGGRYEAYPKYKPSGVEWLGDIPEGWLTIQIGRLFRRTKRTGFVAKELLSVYRDHGVVPKSSRDDNNNKPSEDLSPYQLVQQDDLVLNKMKTWQGSIAVSNFEGIVSPAYFVYQPEAKLYEVADPKYVHFLVRNPIYIAQYLRRSKGIRVSQWDLDPGEFQRIELVLPPRPEQTKIAAFLDHETAKIDALIAKQERLIALLEEKRQAVISHAVTKGLNPDTPLRPSGIDWLGDVPAHWETSRIKHLAATISKGTTPSTMGSELTEKGVRFLKAENIGKSVYAVSNPEFYISEKTDELLSRSRLCRYDVLVIIAGATTGQASIVAPDLLPANTNQAVSFIRPYEPLSAHFILNWLSTDFAQRNIWIGAVQAAQPNLSMESLGNIPLALPPEEEMSAILAHISTEQRRYQTLLTKAQSAITLLKERRTALISAAVTGKIDVRDWQPPKDISDQDTIQKAFA